MEPLRLASLNVERSKHLNRVGTFLRAQQPDIVCLQEVCQHDLDYFSALFDGARPLYAPMTYEKDESGVQVVHGVAIFSRIPFITTAVHYYAGNPSVIPECDTADPATYNNCNHMVLRVDIAKGDQVFRVCTTHFPWSTQGRPNDLQRTAMKALLDELAALEPFVLCGDFNAPRVLDGQPGEIFVMLSNRYIDNIPAQYETSIDIDIHRAGKIDGQRLRTLMVDGLFTAPEYQANDVELVPGISDHFAIVANIERTALESISTLAFDPRKGQEEYPKVF